MQPLIFLSFANDRNGRFLEALDPERRALRQELSLFQRNGWGYYHSSSSSEPQHLVEDLQLYPREISIFHFSGHSDGESLQLERPDGDAVHIHRDNISAILREEAQAQLKLVFLNACKTSGLLDTFQEIGVPAIIATQASIPDSIAKEFSLAFYRSLMGGNTLETAFLQAKSIIEADNPERRISPFRTLEFEDEREKELEMNFAWGLYYKNEEILSWRLIDTNVSNPKSKTKALNKIPGSHQDFVGRDKELRELRHLLQKEKPVLLLNGIGGIGKTTLARQYLHDNYFHFDHIVWVSVLSEQREEEKGFQTATDALANDVALMEKLGVVFDKDKSVSERAGELLNKLRIKTGKNLLVIDNAGFSLEEIRKELPQPPNWQVLITSRKELPGLSVKRLDELPPAEALELFYLHYPQGKNHTEDVEALLKHIGYHTLTLELFAKTCHKSPSTTPAKILKLLQDQALEKLSRKVFSEHSNREVAVYSYLLAAFELHELTEEELSILIQWAILPPQEISWELLCQIYGIEEAEIERFEDRVISLQENGWIKKGHGGENYQMHQLMQEVLRYKHEPTEVNCLEVIQGVTDLLYVDDSKDNPIDIFPFVLYGESVLATLKGNEIVNLQNNLALRYKDLGEYSKAEGLLEWVLASDLKSLGENHSSTATSRSNLALVYQEMGDYSKAAGLLELSLTSTMKSLGKNHPQVAIYRSNLAMAYRDLGDYPKAASLLELSLASIKKRLGEDHSSTAISRSNLAMVYQDLGDYNKAVGLLELSLASVMKRFGGDHPSTARSRSNLALAYKDLGDYSKAVGLLEMALASGLKSFGEDHPSTAINRSNLALVYKDLGDYSKAASLLELALASDQKNFGEDHPSTTRSRSNLASVYQDLGEYSKAAGLLELSLASTMQSFGEDHPSTAIRRSNLALVYMDLEDYSRAAGLMELALVSDQKNFGEEHPSTARSRSNLALVYQEMGDYSKAAGLLELALASDLKSFGEDHPSTAIRRTNLALVYQDLGDYPKAADLLELALASDLKNFGEEHPSTARSKLNLGSVYLDLERKEEAHKLFITAYDTFLKILGPDHPSTINAKDWLDDF